MLHQFYKKSPQERRHALHEEGFSNLDVLAGELNDEITLLDRMSENVIGACRVPLGVLTGIVVNGREHCVAMATEEPSVIAAVNRTARVINRCGGIKVDVETPLTHAQMMFICARTQAASICRQIEQAIPEYIRIANRCDACLVASGGGAVHMASRVIEADNLWTLSGDAAVFVVLTMDVRTCDAMGANAVNTMAEAVMREITAAYGEFCEPGMAILSNAGDGRLVHARLEMPFDVLSGYVGMNGELFARRMVCASQFAENCPSRAITHNKGIMNGIVAVCLPLGQDTRAIEAAAYDFACRTGLHRPLSRWFVEDSRLCGELEMPVVAGYVGGFRKNPAVDEAFKFDGIQSYAELCSVISSVGLAQNMGALWALMTEGIQAGHMKLHIRKTEI